MRAQVVAQKPTQELFPQMHNVHREKITLEMSPAQQSLAGLSPLVLKGLLNGFLSMGKVAKMHLLIYKATKKQSRECCDRRGQ